jgi:phosphoglycerol transferase
VINLVALVTGLFVFRATNRIGVFVAMLVLAFLAVRLSRLTATWRPGWRAAAATVLAAIGLLDQLPVDRRADAEKAEIAAAVASDRTFGRQLETALPPGAMVFQLPVLPFPEPVPIERLSDYEHFRPYLVTQGLRFSYGVAKFRPRARWQVELENQPAREIVRRLERAGFAALYINRKGFADGGEALLGALEEAGHRRHLTSPRGQQVAVLLKPDPQPTPPFGRALTVGRGWQNRPWQGARWAAAEAGFLYYNPLPSPVVVRLTIRLRSPADQTVTLRGGNETLATARLGTGDSEIVARNVVLKPGINSFLLVPGIPAVRHASGPLRAIGLLGSTVDRSTRGTAEIRAGDGASPPLPLLPSRE